MTSPSPSSEEPSPTSPENQPEREDQDEALSSDDEDDEEVEEEPQLKYERIGGDIAKVVRSDLVSTVCVGSKMIAIGSHNGKIYLFDLKGNELKRVKAHTASVSDLSLDKTSEYLASSSIDGKVIVQGLEVKETQVLDFKRPVRCVALDPEYGRSSSRRVVSGGMAGQLIMSEKGWFGNSETTLDSGEGPIYAISWKGPYIAWANDAGVKIWHIPSQQKITSIDRSADAPRADLYKCRLIWRDDNSLIIGWDDCVTTVAIKVDPALKTPPHGEIEQFFQMDSIIAGLLPYPPNILVLSYTSVSPPSTPSSSEVDFRRRTATRPELRIISPDQEELSSDALSLKDYVRLQPGDYSLHWNEKRKCVYIVSPSDIVVGRERTAEDRVQWLLDRGKYREALEVFESSTSKDQAVGKWNRKEIGVKYIEHLIEEGQWEEAADRMPTIFALDAALWEKNIFLFAEKGHLREIAPHVPTKDIVLPSLVYEMILGYYLDTSPAAFLSTVHTWPSEIYNPEPIIAAVQTKWRANPSDKNLMESLAELYLITDQPREVVKYYVRLDKPETFEFIRRFRLFDVVKDDIVRFLQLKSPAVEVAEGEPNPEGLALLVDHSHTIIPETVLKQLSDYPYFQYCYIRALREREGGFLEDWGDLQVELYAAFNRAEFLHFLKTSNTYNLEKARTICEKKSYTQELVFIFSRMGDNKRALTLIIEKLEDVEMAVDFVRGIGDEDLWSDLIDQAKSKPAFIKGLLEHAGSILDPIRLVKSIPPGMKIEGLKESLIKIFFDHEIQMSLSIGVAKIFATDVSNLSKRLRSSQKRGVCFDASQSVCSVCKESVSIDAEDDFIAFFCGHIYHKECLLEPEAVEAVNASRVRGLKQGGVADKITEAALLKPYLKKGCEVCGVLDFGKIKDKGKGVVRIGV